MTLQIGGFAEEYEFSVKIPKGALGSLRTKVNQALQFDGKIHRITQGRDSPSNPMVTLTILAE